MEAIIVGIVVILGLFMYYGWKDIEANKTKEETPPDAKQPDVVVVSTKVDVITAETVSPEPKEVPKELLEAQVNVEKVKRAARKTAAKPVPEEAPAKVTKVKRQYTKKAKE